jgi:hypothetical protein
MNMKAVLVVIYLLFLIAATVRISCMKVMNDEATIYLVLAAVLGVVVLLVQNMGCGCGCKCPLLNSGGKKCNCGKRKGKENFQAANLYYRMSLTEEPSKKVKGKSDNVDGSPLDYLVSQHDGVKVEPQDEVETVKESNTEEKPENHKGGAPLNYVMGPYSAVRLDTEALQYRKALTPGFTKDMYLNEMKSNCGDRKSPCNVPYQQPKFITPTGLETQPELSKQHNPSIDGKKDSKRSMFMFSHNVCHPGCCPSTYSCDHGCVCTNKDQREYLGNHGTMKN